MEKVKTEYISNFNNESVKFEVNEEYPEHIRVSVFQERWRTKQEWISLYRKVIQELKDFT